MCLRIFICVKVEFHKLVCVWIDKTYIRTFEHLTAVIFSFIVSVQRIAYDGVIDVSGVKSYLVRSSRKEFDFANGVRAVVAQRREQGFCLFSVFVNRAFHNERLAEYGGVYKGFALQFAPQSSGVNFRYAVSVRQQLDL